MILEYSIPIYPTGSRDDESFNAVVSFISKEEKKSYMMKENISCMRSINKYYDALKNKNRDIERQTLDLCRVKFAVDQGYYPTAHNMKVWRKGKL